MKISTIKGEHYLKLDNLNSPVLITKDQLRILRRLCNDVLCNEQ